MKTFVPCVLLLGAVPVALAQANNNDDAPLQVNREADSYAIAEQLYAQARMGGMDSASRRGVYQRAAALFGEFAKQFPQSSNAVKAIYLQAVCLDEAGDDAASSKVLATLANTKKGEYASFSFGTRPSDQLPPSLQFPAPPFHLLICDINRTMPPPTTTDGSSAAP
ncbi:MAG: hypothetical protein IJ985_02465 [Akkermansia sp.]|nr:hypothetical protein [Akkermansia sp.]